MIGNLGLRSCVMIIGIIVIPQSGVEIWVMCLHYGESKYGKMTPGSRGADDLIDRFTPEWGHHRWGYDNSLIGNHNRAATFYY